MLNQPLLSLETFTITPSLDKEINTWGGGGIKIPTTQSSVSSI